MNKNVRINSETVRVRGHFLVKLDDWQWALAKHGIAAGEATDDDTIRVHLEAARADLSYIAESANLLGFDKLGNHAEQIRHLMDLFLVRCLGTSNSTKLLTDVILELNTFVCACKRLTEQTTVLECIDLPCIVDLQSPSDRGDALTSTETVDQT